MDALMVGNSDEVMVVMLVVKLVVRWVVHSVDRKDVRLGVWKVVLMVGN